MKQADSVMEQSLEYLRRLQLKNGKFESNSCFSADFSDEIHTTDSIFTSLLILQALAKIEHEDAKVISQDLASYILTQKSAQWTWNYWERESGDQKREPYPEDLDDTALAYAALFAHDESIIAGDALAKFVMLLTVLEKQEGGPYRTWVVPENGKFADQWLDVDAAVNSNVGFTLAQHGVYLDSLVAYIEELIDTKTFSSPYYHTDYPALYFLSRWYSGRKVDLLCRDIMSRRQQDHSWGNPLHTALALMTLHNFGYEDKSLQKSVDYVCSAQKDGHWPAYAFVVEKIEKAKGQTTYSGSAALTTALCVEAIHTYSTPSKQPVKEQHNEQVEAILELVENRFSTCGADLQQVARSVLHGMIDENQDKQIILLPYWFAEATGEQKQEDFLQQLSLLSVFGWMAYTVIDNIIDDEEESREVSVGMLCLREAWSIAQQLLPEHSEFTTIVSQTFDSMDSANAWEVAHTRFEPSALFSDSIFSIDIPNYAEYDKLVERSFGHALGPIAILLKCGADMDSLEMQATIGFFSAYILARQLLDDAHDWEEDLRSGRINSAGAFVLQKYVADDVVHRHLYPQEDRIAQLRHIFWYDVISDMTERIFVQVEAARKHIETLQLKNPQRFLQTLDRIKKSAQEAESQKKNVIHFLEEYHTGFGGERSILVVDDDADYAEMIKEILTSKGYRVTATSDGEEAIAKYKEETYSLVLLDMIMPKMDGRAVSQKMKAHNADIPIVLMSGAYAQGKLQHKIQSDSVDRVVHKSVPMDEYLAVIEEYI